MGKLNLASIKAKVAASPTVAGDNNQQSAMDSQLSTYPDSNRSNNIASKVETRPDGTVVRRAKDAQIIIRASSKMRRELKRWAVDEDVTVQHLVVEGLRALRRQRGLPDLPE